MAALDTLPKHFRATSKPKGLGRGLVVIPAASECIEVAKCEAKPSGGVDWLSSGRFHQG